MNFLKVLAQFLVAPPVIMFFYDLITQFVGHNRFLIRPLREWFMAMLPSYMAGTKMFIASVTSSGFVDKMFALPGPLVMLAPPLFFFLIYRLIFILQGGKAGGYKSRH